MNMSEGKMGEQADFVWTHNNTTSFLYTRDGVYVGKVQLVQVPRTDPTTGTTYMLSDGWHAEHTNGVKHRADTCLQAGEWLENFAREV